MNDKKLKTNLDEDKKKVTYAVGDKIEHLGRKAGEAIEKFGDKIEHLEDDEEEN